MSHNDPFLHALSGIARSEDIASDQRLEQMAMGRLSPDQEQALLRDLGANRSVAEAFRPLGSEFREAMVDLLLEQEQPTPAAVGKVIAITRRRRVQAVVGALSAIAAAAALFLLVLPDSSREGALPRYELVIQGGESPARSLPAAPAPSIPRLLPGSRLDVRMRPAARVQGDVALRGALVRGQDIRPWTPRADIDPSGAFRVTGTREELFGDLPSGTWDIVVAVGRRASMPSDLRELAHAQTSAEDPDSALQIKRFRVELAASKDDGVP